MPTAVDRLIHRYVLLNHPFFKTSADDTLKWMPFGLLFLLDLLGTRTRSGWKRQVLIAGAAESIKYLISDNLKKVTHEQRPAPYTGKHSFPSGHTSTAFSTAEFLHSELKDSLPVLSYSGYAAATTVAVIRIMKNRHWLKDAVVGAAVGIISTKLAYLIVNNISKTRRDRRKSDEEREAELHNSLSKEPNRSSKTIF
ncbi:MAG TPA: phosphatase PAP2 family protein [Chitinophagaceae bacterium]|jgi:membrane-associated phospholipid phosphatase|nr:phosphatase PAP2 family protein [Chitinophagaceae bacterium]